MRSALHSRGEPRMKSLMTATTVAVGLGLALPAFAQTPTPRDPGQESPLAQKSSPLAQRQPNQRDPGQESPLAQRDQGLAQAQDCSGMWKRADLNNDGLLAGSELDKFRSVIDTVDTNKDGKISQSEFTTA